MGGLKRCYVGPRSHCARKGRICPEEQPVFLKGPAAVSPPQDQAPHAGSGTGATMGLLSTVGVLLCLVCPVPVLGAAGNASSSKARSCSDLRRFYTGKGFTLTGVPQTEISGEHLRMCPQGPTCCTSAMEDSLAGLGARETEGLIREAGRSLQAALNALYRSFDSYFMDLHARSEHSLQDALSPLGALYSQNIRLYTDLYADLRRYYRGSALNLEETISEFWFRLLERAFKNAVAAKVHTAASC